MNQDSQTSINNTRPRQSPPGFSSLLDIHGLAERLGVSERFVRRLIAERRVPFFKVGKFIRFDANDIERWIEEKRVA